MVNERILSIAILQLNIDFISIFFFDLIFENRHHNQFPQHHTTENFLNALYIGDLQSSVIHHWSHQLKPYLFPLRKKG